MDSNSNNVKVIILLAGWSGAGKDTVADFLVEHHGFRKTAFAYSLKNGVYTGLKLTGFEVEREWFDTQEGKQKVVDGKTLRQHLIDCGEKVRKEDGPGAWAHTLIHDVHTELFETSPRIVISDWRNIHEMLEVQWAYPNAKIIPIYVRRPSQLISPVPDLTEYALMGFPFRHILMNDGTTEQLRASVDTLIAALTGDPSSLSTPSTTGSRGSDSTFSGFYIF